MNQIKKLSIILIILLIISIAIIGFVLPRSIQYKKYLSDIKSQFDAFLYEYDDFEDELPVIICDDEHDIIAGPISKNEAIEDTEYLFSLLKYGYAGYQYFGGDEAFNLAKDNIIWSIKAINEEDICRSKFLDIIYNELKFIQDSHFTIGHYKLCQYTKYYSSRKFTFHKDDLGLYTFLDNKKYYLTTINDEEP